MLLTEAGGESASEVESDVEDLALRDKGEFGEHSNKQNRIFKHLSINDKFVQIPNLPEG